MLTGALWLLYSAISAHYRRGPLAIEVKRADLIVLVSGEGVVESADNLDLQNPVPGRRNILAIVPDGSYVRKGDLLLRLDSASLEEAIAAERASLSQAEAAVVRAK
ncbi:MAG TPA: biotin/lipoyl-binding protein, partial [Pirellulales bacterium]|nr:biotin/lipoyl-binding protein [Pirellulales bacterium]